MREQQTTKPEKETSQEILKTNAAPSEKNHKKLEDIIDINELTAFINKKAMSFCSKNSPLFDELTQAAWEKIITTKKYQEYDPSRGVLPKYFLEKQIRGAMADELRKYDTESAGDRQLIKKIDKIPENIKQTGQELHEILKEQNPNLRSVSLRKVRECQQKANTMISSVISYDECGEIFHENDDQVAELSEFQLKEFLQMCLPDLLKIDPRYELLYKIYFLKEDTLTNVGETLGSRSQATRLKEKFLKDLKILMSQFVPELEELDDTEKTNNTTITENHFFEIYDTLIKKRNETDNEYTCMRTTELDKELKIRLMDINGNVLFNNSCKAVFTSIIQIFFDFPKKTGLRYYIPLGADIAKQWFLDKKKPSFEVIENITRKWEKDELLPYIKQNEGQTELTLS